VFVLDMGEPVRIVDLAENMIRLSGREPGRDIAVEIVGIRPGEKLREELFNIDEAVTTTRYEKIRRATRPPLAPDVLRGGLAALERSVGAGDAGDTAAVLWQTLRGRDAALDPERDWTTGPSTERQE
jgi:FlaA1/EpsC-like NDP-sugar epimerase